MAKAPNILLIMSDEHDPAVTGCYGDRIVHTPHLDRLAAGGVTFDACYTTSPLCVPARLSFTSGKYVSRVGAWGNDCRLASDDIPSLPRVLRTAGYDPYLCGKMHYDRRHRYGFNDLLPEMNPHVTAGHGGRLSASSTERNIKSWQSRIKQFFVGDVHESGIMKHDVKCTQRAVEFLTARQKSDKPFFMTLGYLAPHFPLIVPQKFYEAMKGRVPMPQLPDGWFERLPTNYKQLIYGFGIDNTDTDLIKRGRELYWALTSWMDVEIGKVLTALRQSAVGENTIVIYTSDHGENKGDHGMWWKNNMYEHSARVPLIVNFPDGSHAGERRAGACSLLDVVQTVAGLAGARTPDDWNGSSMLNYIRDAKSTWKDTAVSEYYGHNIASGYAMIRQGEWKYVYHNRMDAEHGPERELYNLRTDAAEWNNLAAAHDQQARIAAMHAALVAELGRDPEEAEAQCRSDYARGYAD